METIKCLNRYFPKVISGVIFDILAFGVMDSCDAARYGVTELIKYPESAINEITKFCSMEVIKTLFPLVEQSVCIYERNCMVCRLHVYQVPDMIYCSLLNGRKDIYDNLYTKKVYVLKKTKKLIRERCRTYFSHKNVTMETIEIIGKITPSKIHDSMTCTRTEIYESDNVNLYDYIKSHDLFLILLCNAVKILNVFARNCSDEHKKYIDAFYGDRNIIDELMGRDDTPQEYLEIITAKNGIIGPYTYSMEILSELVSVGHITPEQFVDFISQATMDYDDITIRNIKLETKIHDILVECGLEDEFILYGYVDNEVKYTETLRYDVFGYMYHHDIDELNEFINRYGCKALYDDIFSIAAFYNNVAIMDRMYKLGADNFRLSAICSILSNSMDAFIYIKPHLTNLDGLINIARKYKSHYVSLDLGDNIDRMDQVYDYIHHGDMENMYDLYGKAYEHR